MSLGVKCSTFAAALIFSCSVFAEAKVCPELSDIQAVGIQKASQLAYNYFIGYSVDHYQTSSSWGFAIGPIESTSEEDTIDISNEILADMTAPGVPESGKGDDLVCIYETGDSNVFAVAIKGYEEISPMRLKKYLHR